MVELNRAVAVAMAFGPADGLALVDALAQEPALRTITCCPACAAICLFKLDRLDEARAEFERAATLARRSARAGAAAGAGRGMHKTRNDTG